MSKIDCFIWFCPRRIEQKEVVMALITELPVVLCTEPLYGT